MEVFVNPVKMGLCMYNKKKLSLACINYSELQTYKVSKYFFLDKPKFVFLLIGEKGSSLMICFSNLKKTMKHRDFMKIKGRNL